MVEGSRFVARAGALALCLALLAPNRAHADEPPPRRAVVKIGFEDAVRRALTRNPQAELAIEEVRRSEALVQQARSGWLPTLNANGTYTRLDSDRELAGRVLQGANSFNANLLLTVPLLAPRAWVATTRAKEATALAKLSVADTRRQVALAVGRAYLTVLAQQHVLATSVHARDTARAHEEFAKSRLAGGVGNRLDAVRAAQERATSETRVQSQVLALSRAQEALGVLLGENGPVDVEDALLAAPPNLNEALGDAVARRQDVVVSRERVEAARKTVRDSYVDFLPLLSAVVQPFYQEPPTLTFPQTGWQAQLLLTLPLFDGGNRYGLKHEREALHEQAKTRLDAALRQARSEVRIAFESVERSDAALAQARDAAKLAAEALELTELAYRAGATSNIEVIDAERRARDAETEAAVAEDAARQGRLDLLSASGHFP